jgi:HSP20 family molecular chaperone IbpA
MPDKELVKLRYFRNERPYGKFSCIIQLPKDMVNISPDVEIKACLVDGVLEIQVMLL